MKYRLGVFFLMMSPISAYAESCVEDGDTDTIFLGSVIEGILPTDQGRCSTSENDAIEDEYRRSKLADSTYRHIKIENLVDTAKLNLPVIAESEPSSFLFEQLSAPDLGMATQVRTASGYITVIPAK